MFRPGNFRFSETFRDSSVLVGQRKEAVGATRPKPGGRVLGSISVSLTTCHLFLCASFSPFFRLRKCSSPKPPFLGLFFFSRGSLLLLSFRTYSILQNFAENRSKPENFAEKNRRRPQNFAETRYLVPLFVPFNSSPEELQGLGTRDGVWRGSPHSREKKEFLFEMACGSLGCRTLTSLNKVRL